MHTSINKPLILLNGNVLTSGGAGNLAKGQMAIVSTDTVSGGRKALADFDGLSKNTPLQIRVGRNKVPKGLRSNYAKVYETSWFKPSDIVSIKANFPKHQAQAFDEIIIGYDGINTSTALNIPVGKSSVIDFTLNGKAIEVFAGEKEHTVKLRFGREEGQTNQEIVRKLVERMQGYKLPRSQKEVSELVEVSVIDSTNVALAGTAYMFSTLTLTDNGDSNDLADIQAQYPLYQVERTKREGLVSTYTILHPEADAVPAYVLTQNSAYVKGCADCLAGYSTIVGGVVYHVELEDDGVDLSTTVDNLPGYVAGTVVKTGQNAGVGVYSIVLDNALTDAEKDTFLATSAITATAVISEVGSTESVCEDINTTSNAWVDGLTCFRNVQNYTIQLKDNECGESRLAEIQAAYPSLTIFEGTGSVLSPVALEGGCQRTYTTSVTTNLVCDECDPIFLDYFSSQAPSPFEQTAWEKVEVAFDENALMGIRIKGKGFNVVPSEELRDEVPFYETSTRIKSVAGGYREMDYLNITPEYNFSELFSIKRVSRAIDRDALGVKFFPLEEISRAHYLGEVREKGNLFAKGNLGEESLIKFNSQYITYDITWQDSKLSQGVGGRSNITHTEQIVVEFGYHDKVETLINKLATKAGVEVIAPTAN